MKTVGLDLLARVTLPNLIMALFIITDFLNNPAVFRVFKGFSDVVIDVILSDLVLLGFDQLLINFG